MLASSGSALDWGRMQHAEEKAGKTAEENARDESQEVCCGETLSNSLHLGFPRGIHRRKIK